MAEILVIDDDAGMCGFLATCLSRAGHAVATVRSGADALDHLDQRSFDLVVTDIFMPGMDGLELLRAVLRHHPRMPALAISGGGRSVEMDYLRAARAFGAAEVLAKPFTPDALVNSVARLLSPEPAVT